MPGTSYAGPLPPLTDEEQALHDALRQDVETLAGDIGERNVFRYPALTAARDFIEGSFAEAGYAVERQGYDVSGRTCYNLDVERTGSDRKQEVVVLGAHYDTVAGCPGANDNGTGVAALLALARRFAREKPSRTLRFAAFVNEEPPFFQTSRMGSLVYARRCRAQGVHVAAMLSLETIGYYRDEADSQHYPFPLGLAYPSTGNFIAFVGNVASHGLVRDVVGSFRRRVQFPSEGGAFPSLLPGVGWSDHWAFWQTGYPALMVTDTAPFRYPHYHMPDDTPDKIHYEHLARLVAGLERVTAELADAVIA